MLKRLMQTFLGIAALAVLPALADSPKDEDTIALPYVAVGGSTDGWHFQTVLSIGNLHTSVNSGTLEFFGDDGEPFPVQVNDASEMASEFEWTVYPQRAKLVVISHPGNDFQSGWLRLKVPVKSDIQ